MSGLRGTDGTPLAVAFYGQSNIDFLQESIRKSVKDSSGYTIGPQNPADLKIIMGKYYSDIRYDYSKYIDSQISAMNSALVKDITHMIVTNIKSNLTYLNDISKRPMPMDLPQNTSIYGTNLQR